MQPSSGFIRHRKRLEADIYCWTCHRDEPELFCSKCVRSFHKSFSCSHVKVLSEEEITTWRCQECLDIEKGVEQNKTEKIDPAHLKKALNSAFGYIDDKIIKPFMIVDYPKGKVVNTMDLNTVCKKIDIGAYSCCEDFWSDIKWIVHNTKAHCLNANIVKAAKSMYNIFKQIVYCIRMCHECYTYMDERFATLCCSKPHILVWAKQRGYPFWPAKLMRYNVINNTFDVRYFGEGYHPSAVIPAKDCFLFSQQSPGIGNVTPKITRNALKEAECYIKNLIEKYGSFNYANRNTVLHGNMLDRHLYDTIPGAWKMLGHSVVPPPIPKPLSALAISARRMSLPAQRTKRIFPTPPPQRPPPQVFDIGRIMTRRLSAFIDGTLEEKEKSKAKKAIPYRRQSVQIDQFSSEMKVPPLKLQLVKEKSPTAAKKRRMTMNFDEPPAKYVKVDATQMDSSSSPIQGLSTDSVFKVPAVPKIRRSSLSAKRQSPSKSTNNGPSLSVINQRELNKKSSVPVATEPNDSNRISPPNPDHGYHQMKGHSDGMTDFCKAMIDKNSKQITESVRLSLSDALFDCLDTTKSNEQSLHEQLEKQRSSYEQIVDGFRVQNRDLKALVKKYKDKYSLAKSRQDDENPNELKQKYDAIVDELEKSNAKFTETTERLTSMTTKNTYLIATIAKLQATNIEYANNLKSVKAKNTQLVNVNKNLMDGNNKLNATNKKMLHELQELQIKNDATKSQAYEQYARMITDIKRKQWCSTCGMPGGQYFCSEQCQGYARNPIHRQTKKD